MNVKVVDASAIAAVLFGEPEATTVVGQLAGGRLVAPALLRYEVANIAWKKIKRNPAQRDEFMVAFQLLGRMAVDTTDVEHAEVLRLADATSLTAYDASYLWLARKLNAELITLDRRLATVASASNASLCNEFPRHQG